MLFLDIDWREFSWLLFIGKENILQNIVYELR